MRSQILDKILVVGLVVRVDIFSGHRDCFVDGCKAVNAFDTFELVEGGQGKLVLVVNQVLYFSTSR